MPELWEICNTKSQAVLIQLYWQEHGCYPEFYHYLTGDMEKPQPAPEIPDELLPEIAREMSSNSDVKAMVK